MKSKIKLYGLIAIVIVGVFLYWLFKISDQIEGDTVGYLIGVAGLFVTLSSIGSIGIAVMTYVESEVIRKKLVEADQKLDLLTIAHENKLKRLTDNFHDFADKNIKGLTECFMSAHTDTKLLEHSLRQLKIVSVDVYLSKGTYESLNNAIDTALKLGLKRYLDIEQELRSQASKLPPLEGGKLLNRYLRCKEAIVKIATS